MKAFTVYYNTPGTSTSRVVLAKGEDLVPEALAKKDKDYKIGNNWSRIERISEIPLSNVLISSLSVTELLEILKEAK